MSDEDTSDTGLRLATGTINDGLDWIGHKTDTSFAPVQVNPPMIQHYAMVIRDGNPSFWDEQFAHRTWGDIRSPPGMLITWRSRPVWQPGETSRGSWRGPLMSRVPLPRDKDAIINVRTNTDIHRPLLVGDRLNWTMEITDVTGEKETSLGPGHFISMETEYYNQRGDPVATNKTVTLRHESDRKENQFENQSPVSGHRVLNVDPTEMRSGENRTSSKSLREISPEDEITGYTLPVTYSTIIQSASATRDFYPGHHDPEFAQAQGNETIYLNTMTLQGLMDRVAIEWAGPEWRVERRELQMRHPALAGRTLNVTGSVTDIEDEGRPRVTIDATIFDSGTSVAEAEVTILKRDSP